MVLDDVDLVGVNNYVPLTSRAVGSSRPERQTTILAVELDPARSITMATLGIPPLAEILQTEQRRPLKAAKLRGSLHV
jgi:hypothetical protein